MNWLCATCGFQTENANGEVFQHRKLEPPHHHISPIGPMTGIQREELETRRSYERLMASIEEIHSLERTN